MFNDFTTGLQILAILLYSPTAEQSDSPRGKGAVPGAWIHWTFAATLPVAMEIVTFSSPLLEVSA